METERNRAEVVREAADKLRIVGTGQELEADHAEQLDRALDPLFAQLAADGICNVANENHIPVEWFDAIAGLLANVCASAGGTTFDPRIKEYYEMQLKRLNSSRPTYAVQDAEYF